MIILLFVIAHWYLSLFSQSFFLHRYAAHGMFKMSRSWEKFFFVFSVIAQGSSYLSAYVYGILHRMHHAFADTEKDPHSPKYDGNLFAMMWRTRNIYKSIFMGKLQCEERFKKGVPQWTVFDKVASSVLVRTVWVVFYIAFYIAFAEYWWMYLLIPLHIVMGPAHGVIINWFAHKYGYTNFDVANTSKNLLPVDLLMIGEAYHNNHHKRSTSPNFGFRWFELDITYFFIRVFNRLGIIQLGSR